LAAMILPAVISSLIGVIIVLLGYFTLAKLPKI